MFLGPTPISIPKGDGVDVDEYKSIDQEYLQHVHISMPKVGKKHAIQDVYNIPRINNPCSSNIVSP